MSNTNYLKGNNIFSWLSPPEREKILKEDLTPVEHWHGKKKVESLSKASSPGGKEIDLKGIYYQPIDEEIRPGVVDDMNRICVVCKEYILSNQGYCRVKNEKVYICRSCRNKNLRCTVHPDIGNACFRAKPKEELVSDNKDNSSEAKFIGREIVQDGVTIENMRQCTNCILTKLYLTGSLKE